MEPCGAGVSQFGHTAVAEAAATVVTVVTAAAVVAAARGKQAEPRRRC